MTVKPIYVIQNGVAVLDTSQICADGKYIAVPADQQQKVFSGLPKTADPVQVSQNNNFHTINGNMNNNNKTTGILSADLAGYNVPVRAEVANPTAKPQKFKVILDARTATEDDGDYFYVSLGGGLKAQSLLALPALPDPRVTIGGVDGPNTVLFANDFAQNGWVVKGLQIDASSADFYNAAGAAVQYFSLADETTKLLNQSEFDVSYNISDQSFNLTQRKFYEGSGAREFSARLSKMEGIVLGVARGTRVAYTMTLFSSANSAAIYKLD